MNIENEIKWLQLETDSIHRKTETIGIITIIFVVIDFLFKIMVLVKLFQIAPTAP